MPRVLIVDPVVVNTEATRHVVYTDYIEKLSKLDFQRQQSIDSDQLSIYIFLVTP